MEMIAAPPVRSCAAKPSMPASRAPTSAILAVLLSCATRVREGEPRTRAAPVPPALSPRFVAHYARPAQCRSQPGRPAVHCAPFSGPARPPATHLPPVPSWGRPLAPSPASRRWRRRPPARRLQCCTSTRRRLPPTACTFSPRRNRSGVGRGGCAEGRAASAPAVRAAAIWGPRCGSAVAARVGAGRGGSLLDRRRSASGWRRGRAPRHVEVVSPTASSLLSLCHRSLPLVRPRDPTPPGGWPPRSSS